LNFTNLNISKEKKKISEIKKSREANTDPDKIINIEIIKIIIVKFNKLILFLK